ncbi:MULTISPECIES: CxxH/CxxC protein [Cohnella]|uniref:CxxH/CxxC protein n=2 Tax=Cohnella TaxID=329857 RepID=A0A494XKV6_9BACL|nr:CxxH/CxxC protein [Cohnella endophytica]RKP51355.1 CxxH/CxxC protein [Cohnella endophytica]
MYCVCREHVELAIDKFVDEYEDAPDLVNLQTTTFSAWHPPEHCEWCGNKVEILVV